MKFFQFFLLVLIAIFAGIAAFRSQPVVEKIIDVQSHVFFDEGIPVSVSVDLSGQPPIVFQQEQESVESVVGPEGFAFVQLPDDATVIVPQTVYHRGTNDRIPFSLFDLGGYTEEGLELWQSYIETQHPMDVTNGPTFDLLQELLKFGYDWTGFVYRGAGEECIELNDLTVWYLDEEGDDPTMACLNSNAFMEAYGTGFGYNETWNESGSRFCYEGEVNIRDNIADKYTCADVIPGTISQYLYLANNGGFWSLGIQDYNTKLPYAEMVFLVLPLER